MAGAEFLARREVAMARAMMPTKTSNAVARSNEDISAILTISSSTDYRGSLAAYVRFPVFSLSDRVPNPSGREGMAGVHPWVAPISQRFVADVAPVPWQLLSYPRDRWMAVPGGLLRVMLVRRK